MDNLSTSVSIGSSSLDNNNIEDDDQISSSSSSSSIDHHPPIGIEEEEEEGTTIDSVTFRHTALCPIYYPLIYRQNFSHKNNNNTETGSSADIAQQDSNYQKVSSTTEGNKLDEFHHVDRSSSDLQVEGSDENDELSSSDHDLQWNQTQFKMDDDDHQSVTEVNNHQEVKPFCIYAHTTELVIDHNSKIIYSWGGRDNNDSIQFQRYDVVEKKWLPPIGESSEESPATSFYYHSMNYNPMDNSFYIMGGIRSDDSTPDNDVTTFSLDSGEWQHHSFKEHDENCPPTGIFGHVAVYRSFNNTIVLFGGYSDECISTDLFVFDCETKEWMQRIIPYKPIESRSFSTAVYNRANDSIIVYAGELNIEEPIVTCDLVIFHFKTNTWTVVSFEETKICPIPQPIYGNTICLIDNRFLLSLGGCEQSNRIPKNDCFVFDVVRNEWSVCAQLGVAAGRLLCSSLVHDVNGSGLYFYGGKTAEDVATDSIIHVRYRFAGEFFFVEKILQKLKNGQLCDIRIVTPDSDN